MTHGTAAHGTGTHGLTHLGDTTDGMTRSITADIMTHGTMAMADTTEDGTTHGTDTCIRITADGTAVGIHTGGTTITIIIPAVLSTIETSGTATVTRAVQTEFSPAGYRHAEAPQAAESAAMTQVYQQAEWQAHPQLQAAEPLRQEYPPLPEELLQSETAQQSTEPLEQFLPEPTGPALYPTTVNRQRRPEHQSEGATVLQAALQATTEAAARQATEAAVLRATEAQVLQVTEAPAHHRQADLRAIVPEDQAEVTVPAAAQAEAEAVRTEEDKQI
jgi:hypothetical protein